MAKIADATNNYMDISYNCNKCIIKFTSKLTHLLKLTMISKIKYMKLIALKRMIS